MQTLARSLGLWKPASSAASTSRSRSAQNCDSISLSLRILTAAVCAHILSFCFDAACLCQTTAHWANLTEFKACFVPAGPQWWRPAAPVPAPVSNWVKAQLSLRWTLRTAYARPTLTRCRGKQATACAPHLELSEAVRIRDCKMIKIHEYARNTRMGPARTGQAEEDVRILRAIYQFGHPAEAAGCWTPLNPSSGCITM